MSSAVAAPTGTAAPAAAQQPDGRLARARRIGEVLAGRPLELGLLVLLILIAARFRRHALSAPYWIDEGISVGISSHHLADIPGLLRQDGSPPLYYLLLHGWMVLFGGGEVATHALSLTFSILCIPAALWFAWSLFGRRAGVYAATLAAVNPYLGAYGQETRMYALVALLGLVGATAFVEAFIRRKRAFVWVFAVVEALLLYTHNWGLFFGAGTLATLAIMVWRAEDRRPLIRDGVIAFGTAALLYLPWVPFVLGQAGSTGAPWANRPNMTQPIEVFGTLFGGERGAIPLLLGAAVGLAVIFRKRSTESRVTLALIGVAELTLLVALLYSQFNPAYAPRYLGTILGAYLLIGGVALARAGWVGLVALVVSVVLWSVWFPISPLNNKSNADDVAAETRSQLRPGDTVLSTQPEQVPLLYYYLPAGLRYADLFGATDDPRVFDWRGALGRLRRTSTAKDLDPLLNRLPVGSRLLVVSPVADQPARWRAPWTQLVRRRDAQWTQRVATDARLRAIGSAPVFYKPPLNLAVRSVLYEKVRR
jgi:mannosyltransferase